jgi:Fe-S-cluster-containing dehydrogenase component
MSEHPSLISRLTNGYKNELHLPRCLHCKRPKCMEVCEAGAIVKSGAGVVD